MCGLGYGLRSERCKRLSSCFIFQKPQHEITTMSHLALAPSFLAQQAAPGGGFGQIIFLVLMFAAMYFLMIAPQR